MFTRKHFQDVANIIKNLEIPDADRHSIAKDFADIFSDSNPRFNLEKFLQACNINLNNYNQQ